MLSTTFLSDDPKYFKLPIEGQDVFIKNRSIFPSDELFHFVIQCLDKNSHAQPGFAIVPIPPNITSNQTKIEQFQDYFTEMIHSELKDKLPLQTQRRCFLVQDGQEIQNDGFYLHQGQTLKRLHIDRFATIFSHLYYPFENVNGGNLLFFDYRHMMDDLGKQFFHIFQLEKHGADRPEEPMVIPNIQSVANHYTHEVTVNRNYPVLVLVNNVKVSHGVTPIFYNPSEFFKREYRRVCFLSKPLPFWDPWMKNTGH